MGVLHPRRAVTAAVAAVGLTLGSVALVRLDTARRDVTRSRQDLAAGSYAQAVAALQAGRDALPLPGTSAALSRAQLLADSAEAYAQGTAAEARHDLTGAADAFGRVLPADPRYATAQTDLTQVTAAVLSDRTAYTAATDFSLVGTVLGDTDSVFAQAAIDGDGAVAEINPTLGLRPYGTFLLSILRGDLTTYRDFDTATEYTMLVWDQSVSALASPPALPPSATGPATTDLQSAEQTLDAASIALAGTEAAIQASNDPFLTPAAYHGDAVAAAAGLAAASSDVSQALVSWNAAQAVMAPAIQAAAQQLDLAGLQAPATLSPAPPPMMALP